MDAQIVYRPIKVSDNEALARIIRDIFEEHVVPKRGTAYADPAIDDMHTAFSESGSFYIVACENEELLGGAGIAPLKGETQQVCELQKMYVKRKVRQQGLGRQLLSLCLGKAKDMGYTHCYLETMRNMQKAQELYLEYGFDYLDQRLGDTGHFACPVWMLKKL